MEEGEKTVIPLKNLRPNPCQPPERTAFDMIELQALAESIQREGLHYPIVVRMITDPEDRTCWHYEVADGWQRQAAFQWLVDHGHAEYDRIPATLRGYTDDQMADIVLTTSERQRPLSAIGKAWLYRKYLVDHPSVTQAQYAERRGISQGELANTMRLLELPETVRQMIISREISESHGRSLLRIKDPATQADFARSVRLEGWSVAHLDERVKAHLDAIAPKMQGGTAAEDREITRQDGVIQTVPPAPAAPEPPVQTATDTATVPETGDEKPETPVQKPSTSGTASSKPIPKPAATTTAAPTAPPAPARNWGRKLVLEEKDGHVMMSCMKAGGVPVFKKVEGTIYDAVYELGNWIMSLSIEWHEKEVK